MKNYEDRDYAAIWLSLPLNLSPRKRIEWLDNFESATDFYTQFSTEGEYVKGLIGETNYIKLAEYYSLDIIQDAIKTHNQKGVEIITCYDELYPESLLTLDDYPTCLYCLGNVGLLNLSPSLGVVGTRKATRYGKDVTKKLVTEVVHNGIVIVSGMARGVDSIAHIAALDNDGDTIAVVGTGLDMVYPSENVELARRIADKGLIISEYPFGVGVKGYNFPQRNRIISGLSDAILITEAGLKSGSTITADMALDLGKDVMAVPGNITSEMSAGTNNIIKSGAMIITDVNDILQIYNMKNKQTRPSSIQLDFIELSIVEYLVEERHFDEILHRSGLTVESLMPVLLNLELCGVIRKLPGNFYGKTVK